MASVARWPGSSFTAPAPNNVVVGNENEEMLIRHDSSRNFPACIRLANGAGQRLLAFSPPGDPHRFSRSRLFGRMRLEVERNGAVNQFRGWVCLLFCNGKPETLAEFPRRRLNAHSSPLERVHIGEFDRPQCKWQVVGIPFRAGKPA